MARLLARLAGFDTRTREPRACLSASSPSGPSASPRSRRPQALAIDPDTLRGREDVVAAAVLVLHTTLAALGADAYVTARGGLRHGLALAAAD